MKSSLPIGLAIFGFILEYMSPFFLLAILFWMLRFVVLRGASYV